MNDSPEPPQKLNRRRLLARWLVGTVFMTLLIAISTSWQSWKRNTSLEVVTSLPLYFMAIWASYLMWIGISFLIYRWHKVLPMFCENQPLWWLYHLGLSLVVGLAHQVLDTLLLWFALTQSFALLDGLLEKLMLWLPYELLAYWACLCAVTLVTNRNRLFKAETPNYLKVLSVRAADKTKIISVENVDYLEAYDNYVKIWCGENREIIKLTMAHLEKQLNPRKFIRIHRSFIVNLDSIASLGKQDQDLSVTLKMGKSLPISRRRRTALNKLLRTGSA